MLRNKELHASRLGEVAYSPFDIFTMAPVDFGCRVAGYSFTWTIRGETGRMGG